MRAIKDNLLDYLEERRSDKELKAHLNPGFQTICNLLPYRAYEEEERLYYNENSYGFILEATPLCGADEKMVGVLTGMITDGVPEGCNIQVINWASPRIGHTLEAWAEKRYETGGIYKKLAEKRMEHYQGTNWKSLLKSSPLLLRDFRIFIAVSVPDSLRERGKFELRGLRDQLITTLRGANILSYELEPEGLINFLDEVVNPRRSMKRSELKWDKLNYINEHLKQGDNTLEVDPDSLTFRNSDCKTEVRSYSIKNFPEIWTQWMNCDLIGDSFSDYLQIPCPFMTVFSICFGNDDRERNKATLKTTNATRKSGSGLGRFLPEVFAIEKDWKFVTDKLKNGQKLVKVFYEVVLYAAPEEMERCERAVKSLYKSKSWTLVDDKYVQLQSWLAALPFTMSEGMKEDLEKFNRLKTMVTWSCANIAPLQGEWKGMQNSPCLMLTGRKGQPLMWDPFQNKEGNYNVAVVGKSGSGKSVFMQELVSSIRGSGGKVVVIDDGRSFMNSCRMQGGQFIEFSGETKLCINPFSLISEEAFNNNAERYRDDVVNLLQSLIGQMCKGNDAVNNYENSLIQTAILKVWDIKRSEANITDIADYLLNHEDKRAKDLGVMLNPYTTRGVYSDLFNGKSNLSIDNPYTVFELSEIKNKKDLQAVVLLVLMFLVTEMMYKGDRLSYISLVIDEAWDLLHGAASGAFIEGLARRARKYLGNLITGTQSINDYYKNSAAQAALANTDWICFLAQTKESVERLKQENRVSMDSGMEATLKSLKMVDHEYSEIMIYGPGGWSVGRLIIDPYSIALYSSKGEDFAHVKAYQAQGLSLEEAVERVANGITKNRSRR